MSPSTISPRPSEGGGGADPIEFVTGYADGATPFAVQRIAPLDLVANLNGDKTLYDPARGNGVRNTSAFVGNASIWKEFAPAYGEEDYGTKTGWKVQIGACWSVKGYADMPANKIAGPGFSYDRELNTDIGTLAGDGGFRFGLDNAGNIQVLISDWDSVDDVLTGGAAIADDAPASCYIVVEEGVGTTLYVGGVAVDSTTSIPSLYLGQPYVDLCVPAIGGSFKTVDAYLRGLTFEWLTWGT